MTNEVPDIIVDLPTYEQVEDIKKMVDNTGGVTVDLEGKRYKTVVTSPFNFATGVGNSAWSVFTNEMKTKYPELAAKRSMQHGRKFNLRGSIYMSIAGHALAWFDADTMTVLNAIDFEIWNPDFRINSQCLWFEDANYLYIRGTNAATTQFRLGVFDKNTFNYITSITLSGPDFSSANIIDPTITYRTSEIPFLSGNFFLPAGGMAIIDKYRINYGSGGVPTSFTYSGIGTTHGATIFAIFEYKGYIYSLSTDGSYQKMRKYIIDQPTDSFKWIAESVLTTQSTGTISTHARWSVKLTSGNGTEFVLLSFGSNAQILSIALDTMTVKQVVMNGVYDNPVFDFKNGATMWTQYNVVGQNVGLVINGSAFELLFKYTMNLETGWWSNKTYHVPASVGNYTSGSYQRLITLGDYGFSLNNKLLLKYGSNYDATFTEFKMVEGVKEV